MEASRSAHTRPLSPFLFRSFFTAHYFLLSSVFSMCSVVWLVWAAHLSGPYRAMRAAMRCDRRCGVNPEMAMRCDAKSWRCAVSLRKSSAIQRRRDDNKSKIFALRGGHGGREENRPKTFVFVGNATTIKILNVQTLLSRNLVVIAQAPSDALPPSHNAKTLAMRCCDAGHSAAHCQTIESEGGSSEGGSVHISACFLETSISCMKLLCCDHC